MKAVEDSEIRVLGDREIHAVGGGGAKEGFIAVGAIVAGTLLGGPALGVAWGYATVGYFLGSKAAN